MNIFEELLVKQQPEDDSVNQFIEIYKSNKPLYEVVTGWARLSLDQRNNAIMKMCASGDMPEIVLSIVRAFGGSVSFF